ncbi:MAG: hypothetical protein CMQ53_03845 [Gammaproteobacteria bacterium]|nr:hypothetical protein [Gammaproteobacteria bacterium]
MTTRYKYSNPIPVRIYRTQKESLNELMKDREFCIKNNLHSQSDVLRMSLNRTLREFEHNKFRREVS